MPDFRPRRCPDCGGIGGHPDRPWDDCDRCGGAGEVHAVANMARGESYTVRCDRRTRWGNPFRVGVLTREQAVRLHRDWLAGRPLRPDLPLPPTRAEVRGLLGGEVLGCWCHPKPCHCDALAAIADGEDP